MFNKLDRNKTLFLIIAIILILIAASVIGRFLLKDSSDDKDVVVETENSAEELFFNGTPDELDELIKNGRPTIMSFGTKTCIYCEELKPIMAELKEEYDGDVDIIYIDSEDNPKLSKDWPSYFTPSTIIINKDGNAIDVDEDIFNNYGVDLFTSNDGREISAYFGLKEKEDIKRIIDDLL